MMMRCLAGTKRQARGFEPAPRLSLRRQFLVCRRNPRGLPAGPPLVLHAMHAPPRLDIGEVDELEAAIAVGRLPGSCCDGQPGGKPPDRSLQPRLGRSTSRTRVRTRCDSGDHGSRRAAPAGGDVAGGACPRAGFRRARGRGQRRLNCGSRFRSDGSPGEDAVNSSGEGQTTSRTRPHAGE
jgi:hypothetical protein